MKHLFNFLLLVSAFTASGQTPNVQLENSQLLLPNGWSLSPAGRSVEVGDLPLNIAVSASQKLMAVTNNGQGKQSIQLIDTQSEKILDNIEIPKSFYGLKFSSDSKTLYASGGNDNWILKYAIVQNKLVLKDSLVLGKKWPNKISPVGIEIDDDRQLLYVVTKENNSFYILDLKTKAIVFELNMGHEGYTCVLSPNKKTLYISLWGGRKIAVFDTQARKVMAEIPVSYNPNELILSKSGQHLFVANAGDNSVSVIDTKAQKVIEVLDAGLYPNSLAGSVTNGVALSKDEKTLFIANADNNCLAVFDVSTKGKSFSKGFI